MADMPVIRCDWDLAARPEWEGLLARAGRCGLQQAWAYGEALAEGGLAVHRLVAHDAAGRPLACAQFASRRILGLLPVGFLLRGPVWVQRAAAPPAEEAVLREVRSRFGRGLLVWAPEATLRPRGRRPVITGYSTGWLDLSHPIEALRRSLHGKWRNQLVRAERANLAIASEPPGPGLDWLLAANEAHRREIGYRGPSTAFLWRLAAAAARYGDLSCLVAREGGQPVAGILIVRHGAAATYEVGYAGSRGRSLRATYLLLWRAIELLHDAGVQSLDLGGLDTDRAPGVAGFKLGLQPELVIQAGTFLI